MTNQSSTLSLFSVPALGAGLYCIGTPIGNLGDMTPRAAAHLVAVDFLYAEDTRVTGALLSHLGLKRANGMRVYNDHASAAVHQEILDLIAKGHSVGLTSDAGMPLISDPGYSLVRACREQGLTVTVIPSVSSVLTALVASGLSSHRFYFHGFLSTKTKARHQELTGLAPLTATLIFFETMPRMAATIADLAQTFPDRRVTIARELTKKFEQVVTLPSTAMPAWVKTHQDTLRGEAVVLVEGLSMARAHDLDQEQTAVAVTDYLRDLLAAGISVRDAAAQAAARFNIPRKDAYQQALEIKGA
jgi:16S rRNA (cytidine1402-2'-O)-methyltransferase